MSEQDETGSAGGSALSAAVASGAGEGAGTAELVEAPQAVMRVAGMIGKLVEEVRAAPLDEAGRARLAEVHARAVAELEKGLAPELREELGRLVLPLGDDDTPAQAELRVAQAQLLGWLEGLFHGIQSAVLAQQMAARGQLEALRGERARSVTSGTPSSAGVDGDAGGQYL